VYWGIRWWAWAGIGLFFILVALLLTRVLYRAFVRVGELTDALGRAREDLDGALGSIRDSSQEARERLERLRERSSEETGPPTANPYGR
jgi:hypothetical protein